MKNKMLSIALAAIGWVLFSVEANAFYFPTTNGAVHAVDVPQSYTGEVWAVARAESWKDTKNTVWTQCRDVLQSYGDATPTRIRECEQHVADANNITLEAAGKLKVNQQIILPISNEQALAYKTREHTNTRVVVTAESLSDVSIGHLSEVSINHTITRLTDQVTAQGKEIVKTQIELKDGINALTAKIDKIVESIDKKEASLPAAPIAQAVPPKEVSALPLVAQEVIVAEAPAVRSDIARAPPFDRLVSLLDELWWIPVSFFIVLMLLIIATIVLAAMLNRSRSASANEISKLQAEKVAEQEKTKRALRELEKSRIDFRQKTYMVDGQELWVQLEKIDESGRYYRTPYANSVREENLRSHFSQALRKAKAA